MADDSTFVLHDWGVLSATQRTRSSGKQRVTLEIKSEPLLVDLDPQRLGRPVAEAIAELVRDKIQDEGAIPRASTLKRRESAARAFDQGASWAMEEYSGGRLGPMRPNWAKRYGNDSGRLAKSIFAQFAPRVGQYLINVAANRLTPEFRARRPEFLQWLGNKVALALTDERFDQAVARAAGISVQKVRDARAEAKKRLADAARQLLGSVQSLGGELEGLSEPQEP